MLFGQHPIPLDDQNRLTLPERFRSRFGRGLVVTQGFDRNLLLLSEEAFQEISGRLRTMNLADPLARQLMRMLLGSAAELELDASGQVGIPARLCEFAGLDEQAVLVGQGGYLEIWSPALWKAQETRLQDAESNADRFAGLTLAAG
jgi:MraZ protein